ncbi:MAG: ribosomal protein S18-alanine N-acetyltransferase [Actinomycetota bacterium]|nr:ribosomal protein S18-alanine N-acetyltransferase [Actinomycetota bacterium]
MPVERALFPDEPWTERTFWSELGQLGSRHYLVALEADDRADDAAADRLCGERLVGYAGLCDFPDEAWVQTLAVAPEAQGRGLGDRLLTALLDEAARRRAPAVSLEVRADNRAAQRLYERHGFVRTGVRRGYYRRGVDAWVLTRRPA